MAKINSHVKNSRVSIQGRDIILDYEFNMHCYHNEAELRSEGLVPVEMYPYNGDILVGYIPVDKEFGVIDLEALYQWALQAIADETNDSVEEEIAEEEPVEMSREEAIATAAKYGLIAEVIHCMDRQGLSPVDALAEWDII